MTIKMKINVAKTKVMRISITAEKTITVNGIKLKQVRQYCYLRSLITKDSKCRTEIRKLWGKKLSLEG